MIALRDQLFGEGVRELLHASRTERIRTYLTDSSADLDKEIRYFRPNILIIDEWMNREELQSLFQKFRQASDLEMILMINNQNNRVLSFRKQEKDISGIRDLFSIIQNSEIRPC